MELMDKEYIIHASNRGYWRENSRGYTYNPSQAGIYDEKEAKSICCDSSRKEKMYVLNGTWHKRKIKVYRERKCHEIQRVMEGMTSMDVIEVIPELVKERMKRNG